MPVIRGGYVPITFGMLGRQQHPSDMRVAVLSALGIVVLVLALFVEGLSSATRWVVTIAVVALAGVVVTAVLRARSNRR